MWRDEVQAFMLAAGSDTPLDLLARVHYENHPALWYLLLWVVTLHHRPILRAGDAASLRACALAADLARRALQALREASPSAQLLSVLGILHCQQALCADDAAWLRLHPAPRQSA